MHAHHTNWNRADECVYVCVYDVYTMRVHTVSCLFVCEWAYGKPLNSVPNSIVREMSNSEQNTLQKSQEVCSICDVKKRRQQESRRAAAERKRREKTS